MSMIPLSRDNRIAGIDVHHAKCMSALYLPISTQIQQISGSLEMRPITTIIIELISAREIRTSVLPGTNEGFQSTRSLRKWLRRLCAVETVISHMKSENRKDDHHHGISHVTVMETKIRGIHHKNFSRFWRFKRP